MVSPHASGYRPFDGTDAAVAGPGEFELELGPLYWNRRNSRDYLIVPASVMNLGLLPRLELVIDFRNNWATSRYPTEQRDRLLDTDILLKSVLRRGALQGASGPSLALEAGPLTPEIGGASRWGAHADLIVSESGRAGTFHYNQQLEYGRDDRINLFTGLILEGPSSWRFRPVSEFWVSKTFEGSLAASTLVGAIWVLSDSLSVDGAVRGGRIDGAVAMEYRLGFTWNTQLWLLRQTE
jgi:hypothetical protein